MMAIGALPTVLSLPEPTPADRPVPGNPWTRQHTLESYVGNRAMSRTERSRDVGLNRTEGFHRETLYR